MDDIILKNFMSATSRIEENKKRYKIKFIITSHISYYKIALPVMLQSAIEQIPVEDILVVIGDMPEQKNFYHQGIEIQYVTYNDWDHTGIQHLVTNWDKYKNQADYWFNLHDTCQCGPYFSELVYDFPPEIESYAMWDSASSNIGLYKSTYLEKITPKILQQHEEFKIKVINAVLKFEDSLWHIPQPHIRPAYGSLKKHFTVGSCGKLLKAGAENGYDYVYKDDMRKRRVQYFIDVSLYKYKSGNDAAMGFEIKKDKK